MTVDQRIIDTVDDVELLNILGIPPKIAVLDWDDMMPELDEDLDDDKESVVTTCTSKRKYNDEEENIFNQFDFIEVPIVTEEPEKKPESKKRKLSFVENEDFMTNNFKINLDQDIQLALELTSL